MLIHLVEFLVYAALAGLVNCGVYIVTLKVNIYQKYGIRECAFCLMFWLAMLEFFLIFPFGAIPYWIPVSLAAAVAGRLAATNA